METQNSPKKRQKNTPEKKHHFWLFATHVVFTNEEQTEMGNAPINATILNERKCIPAAKIQEAQAQAQHLFHERSAFAGQGLQVVDVFILSSNYLGHMTISEFNKLPEGVAAKQVQREEQSIGQKPVMPRKSSVPEGLK